jgi:hypothetical protein
MRFAEGSIDTTYLSELVGRDRLSLWGIPRLDSLSPRCMDSVESNYQRE